jgi:ABC-type nitrate/sulfonate/bicarbonate transport system ATPase subunit
VYILAGRPGRIINSFEIKAPRPRAHDFTVLEEFITLKKSILGSLKPFAK